MWTLQEQPELGLRCLTKSLKHFGFQKQTIFVVIGALHLLVKDGANILIQQSSHRQIYSCNRIRTSEILPWDRNIYLTHVILTRLSRYSDVIMLCTCRISAN